MKVNVYLCVVPGWDRVFVTTVPPKPGRELVPGEKLFRIDAELPGFEKLDGVIAVVATPVDQAGIRLPSEAKPVGSGG